MDKSKPKYEQTSLIPEREVYTRNNLPPRIKTPVGIASKTKQSFKDDCNINVIMDKYRNTGTVPVHNKEPKYGNFTNGGDFSQRMLQIKQANEDFMELPARMRAQFENDPAILLDFLDDPDNRLEAQELGLLPKTKAEASKKTPEKEKPATGLKTTKEEETAKAGDSTPST